MDATYAKASIKLDLPDCSGFKQVGEGSFGIVYSCMWRNELIAVKQIMLHNLDKQMLPYIDQEIQVTKKVRGQHLIQHLFDLRTDSFVYLGLEVFKRNICQYCRVDTQYILDVIFNYQIPEKYVKYWMEQMASAFFDLHQNRVIHRDLKIENVLLSITEEQLERLKNGEHDVIFECQFKLADMGMAKMLEEIKGVTNTFVGSPLNMAPEILNEQYYGLEADLYSLGVCSYQLLYGEFPFFHEDCDQIKSVIQAQRIDFEKYGINLSDEMKHLLQSLLKYDLKQRMKWSEFYEKFLIKKDEAFINFKKLFDQTKAQRYQEMEQQIGQNQQQIEPDQIDEQFIEQDNPSFINQQPMQNDVNYLYDESQVIKITKEYLYEVDSDQEIIDYEDQGGQIQFINRVANHRNQYQVILLACEKIKYYRSFSSDKSIAGELNKLYLFFYDTAFQIYKALYENIKTKRNFLQINQISWQTLQSRPEYQLLTSIIQKDQTLMEQIETEIKDLRQNLPFYQRLFQKSQPFEAQGHIGEYKKKVVESLRLIKALQANQPQVQHTLITQVYLLLSVELLSKPVNDEDQAVIYGLYRNMNEEQLNQVYKQLEFH